VRARAPSGNTRRADQGTSPRPAVIYFLARTPKHSGGFGSIRLPAEETAKLMSDHVPATLQFSNISYSAGSKPILSSVSGSVKPGQIMAIMGASGAGKSTLLDILGFKLKRGTVGGDIFVNGRRMNAEGDAFKRVVGFVDQEDTLMSTLTVYETVLYSALLRLPRDMSLEAKKYRTLETMQELGILGIKDSRIGEAGQSSCSAAPPAPGPRPRSDHLPLVPPPPQAVGPSRAARSAECRSRASSSPRLRCSSSTSRPVVRPLFMLQHRFSLSLITRVLALTPDRPRRLQRIQRRRVARHPRPPVQPDRRLYDPSAAKQHRRPL
jgi:hypothetical protein